MANLTKAEVEHIAKLSKLELNDEEKGRFCDQLSSVLEYVEQLREVDTENIEPTSNVTGLQNVEREDLVEPSGITYDDITMNAPEFKDGSFVVPGVFE